MRVLFLARTVTDPRTTSIGTGPLGLFRAARDVIPGLKVTWTLPRALGKIDLDPFIDTVNVMGGGRTFDRFVPYMITEEVVELVREHDLIVSNHVASTVCLREVAKVPILNLQMWTGTPRYREIDKVSCASDWEVVHELVSLFYAPNVFESSMLRADMLDGLREMLDDRVMEQLSREPVLPMGVEIDRLDEVYRRRQGRSDPVLFWGGDVWRPFKRFPISRWVLEQAAIATRTPVRVTTFSPTVKPEEDDWGVTPIEHDVDVDQFYEAMTTGDVFVCNSMWESYGIAWLEMLAVGMLGVYMNAWWIEHVLPPWYPFIATDKVEQLKMTIALVNQYPDGPLWEKYGERTRQWVRENHDRRKGGHRLARIMEQMA